MSSKKGIQDEDLIQRLRETPGFAEGYDRRRKIINLGKHLRNLRTGWTTLNQTDAAHLLGMEQSELSRIENGHGERGPSYATLIEIIEHYSEYLRERGAKVTLSLDIDNQGQHSNISLTADMDDVLLVENT